MQHNFNLKSCDFLFCCQYGILRYSFESNRIESNRDLSESNQIESWVR